jgi:peptide/nickel transport system substrate-binding protein
VFERNPGYWNAPQPYLDRVTITVVTDESQRVNTYTAGGADMVQIGAASTVAQMRSAGNGGVEVMNIQNGGSLLFLNTKKLPFSDIRARQALAYGIDRNDYVKTIDSGVLDPIDSLFRHDSPFYDPSLVEPAYDPAKAQQLIDAYVGDNGPLNFTLTSFPTEPYPTQAQYIQGVMNRYKNVKVNVIVEGLPAHLANCFSGNFDNACNAAVFWTDPEPAWTSVYTCDAKPNATGWCNSQFDKYVADNRATLNPNQRITDIKEAQRIFYSELPSISFDRRGAWKFHKPHLKNASFVNDNLVLLAGAWLDK